MYFYADIWSLMKNITWDFVAVSKKNPINQIKILKTSHAQFSHTMKEDSVSKL